MYTRKNFILNLITAFIWLMAGIASLIVQGQYAGICFIACIVFIYLAVISYKRWKADKKND